MPIFSNTVSGTARRDRRSPATNTAVEVARMASHLAAMPPPVAAGVQR
jgi:hypothetical protein